MGNLGKQTHITHTPIKIYSIPIISGISLVTLSGPTPLSPRATTVLISTYICNLLVSILLLPYVLPILECHINWIRRGALIGLLCFAQNNLLKSIHAVVCISNLFLFITELQSYIFLSFINNVTLPPQEVCRCIQSIINPRKNNI